MVQLPGFNIAKALGAAPDGSFRVLASHVGGSSTQEIQVFKIGSDGGAEPLGPALANGDGRFSENSALLDDDGSVWVPFYSDADGAWELEIVTATGTSSARALPSVGVERWLVSRTAFGPRVVPVGGPGLVPWIPRSGTYRLAAGGTFDLAEAYPVEFAEGEFWYSHSADRVSWDAGAHWAEVSEFADPVPRVSGPTRFLIADGGIAERYSPFLYRGVGSAFPTGTSRYATIDAGSALAAYNEQAIYVEPLPLPAAPPTIGPVPADSAGLIARADLFRADAGLPPLTGDAAISQAALNHSLYTVLNQTDPSISAHYETAGRPGFTGSDPGERCEAVGATCFGEVMYAPVADPVGGWLATVYHRTLPGSPELGLVGGGEANGGWFVMDSGAERNVLVEPFGYPVGRWRGEGDFSGEIPDPIDVCHRLGQAIDYPAGVAVTLFLPDGAGTVQKVEVRAHGSSKPLKGCLLGESGSFIPDDPLVKGTTYDVHAEWLTGSNPQADGTIAPGTTLSRDWSFYFQPDFYGRKAKPKPCHALGLRTIKSVAGAHRSGRHNQVLGIEEKVTLKQKAIVRLRQARLNYWKAGDRHSVKLTLGRIRGRAVHVGRTSYLRFRLPPQVVRRVIPGEPAELRLTFTGRRARGCAQVIHVGRIRKVEIGWVRVAGLAAWVSAKRKHRPAGSRHRAARLRGGRG